MAIPVLLWRLWQRGKSNPGYRQRVLERFGGVSVPVDVNPDQPLIWVHTVSVGEFLAAQPLIKSVLARFPEHQVLVTTTTPTGSERVQEALGSQVLHVYMPYDLPHAWGLFLRRYRPAVAVIMETELWPNLSAACDSRNIPLLLVNARLSQKSAQGYQRFHWLAAPMMASLSAVAAQAQPDAERFHQLGVHPDRVEVCGNIKFDFVLPDTLEQSASALRGQLGNERLVWIAASTHPGEDERILDVFRKLRQELPSLLLILVPRHPERFGFVADLVRDQDWKLALRSQMHEQNAMPSNIDVLIGDTMGELPALMAAADVTFMGGSLVPVGGHNVIESLAVGTPVISGSHTFNFASVVALLCDEGVLKLVDNDAALYQAVLLLFQQPEQRRQLSQQGRHVVVQQRGALQRMMAMIERFV